MVFFVGKWYFGCYDIFVEMFVIGDVQMVICQLGIMVFFGVEYFVCSWIVDNVSNQFIFVFQCDGDGKVWYVVQEVQCVIQWIDDLVVGFVGVFYYIVFFYEEVIIWLCFVKMVIDD